MPTGSVFIETFGCQMNDRDSEIMGQLLHDSGYHAAADITQADLIVINTCTIRAKAEQKVFSLVGRLNAIKKKNPALIITIAGCMAQQHGRNLTKRLPIVDIVVGTQHIYELPALIARVKTARKPQVAVNLEDSFIIPQFSPAAPLQVKPLIAPGQFVTIMQGCNNFCAYCVVPHTRGREVSRAEKDILKEISNHLASGVSEITLLGQNVNSYGRDSRGIDGQSRFPDLLRQVAALPGIKRIRFTTSHPKDLSEELIRCFGEIDILCPHFHLPVQAGSNRILKKMNRKYTVEQYLAKVDALKLVRPELALTTDIIVGFPGETEADFEETMTLLDTVRYHGAFSFKYSDRPLTAAAGFPDKVAEAEKDRRLARLQAKQRRMTLERHREYIGQRLEVLVEGNSRNDSSQWCGKSPANQTVNFHQENCRPGRYVMVRIDEALQNSLRGTPCE